MSDNPSGMLSVFAARACPAGPHLTDDQWNCVAGELGSSDPRWRKAIDYILAVAAHEECAQSERAQQRRHDGPRLEKIAKLARDIEILHAGLRIPLLEHEGDAKFRAEVLAMGRRADGRLRELSNGRLRVEARDLALHSLIILWRIERTGGVFGEDRRVGNRNGRLVRFLIAAYRPLGILSGDSAREVARAFLRPQRANRIAWLKSSLNDQGKDLNENIMAIINRPEFSPSMAMEILIDATFMYIAGLVNDAPPDLRSGLELYYVARFIGGTIRALERRIPVDSW